MANQQSAQSFFAFLQHLKRQTKAIGPCAIDILPGNAEHPIMLAVRQLQR